MPLKDAKRKQELTQHITASEIGTTLPFPQIGRLYSVDEIRGQLVHKLLARQLAKAKKASGEIDLALLTKLIGAAYAATDRRRANRSLELMIAEVRASQKRLHDALDVVPEGFALFDAEDRYILWNKHYEEMYPESSDLFCVGKRFEDVLREGVARGQYPDIKGKEEAWIAERLARHAQLQNFEEQHLPGGRWVRVRGTAHG